MRNIAQRIRTMQKRGFKRGKGVASDQFLIEIRRRMKKKKGAEPPRLILFWFEFELN